MSGTAPAKPADKPAKTHGCDSWIVDLYNVPGVSFDGGESGYLLAPDACQGPDGRYYMYAFGDCDQAGGMGSTYAMVADEPQGPYEYIGPVTLDGWTTQNYVAMTEPVGRIDGVHIVV